MLRFRGLLCYTIDNSRPETSRPADQFLYSRVILCQKDKRPRRAPNGETIGKAPKTDGRKRIVLFWAPIFQSWKLILSALSVKKKMFPFPLPCPNLSALLSRRKRWILSAGIYQEQGTTTGRRPPDHAWATTAAGTVTILPGTAAPPVTTVVTIHQAKKIMIQLFSRETRPTKTIRPAPLTTTPVLIRPAPWNNQKFCAI